MNRSSVFMLFDLGNLKSDRMGLPVAASTTPEHGVQDQAAEDKVAEPPATGAGERGRRGCFRMRRALVVVDVGLRQRACLVRERDGPLRVG